MHIKQIIIDGFKSYAKRTVISGFDEHFNAITGLNGSGKSNILDAICFVLGISNLSQVRAGNLQELVYKQGQAGVTKATVSIVFDNIDKTGSPVGYEHNDEITVTRQVVIGGRNKYLINGHNAQLSRVQNLFHSVQLNVNNPHFLIMQGRITKVLNMKPPEILALIEEAAGTRMFETKKASAQKTIEKKEKKIDEINAILNEEITPTLEKLRGERSNYLEYQNGQREMDLLMRFCTAYDYMTSQRLLTGGTQELDELHSQMAELKSRARKIDAEIINLGQNATILERKRDTEAGGKLTDLEKKANVSSQELVKTTTEHQHQTEAVQTERANLASLLKTRDETIAAIADKERELAAAEVELAAVQTAHGDVVSQHEQLKRQVHGFSLASNDGGVKTQTDELMDAKKQAGEAATEAQQATMKIKHVEAELAAKRKAAKATAGEYSTTKARLEAQQSEAMALLAELEAIQYDGKAEAALTKQTLEEHKRVASLREKVDQMAAQLQALDFQYDSPSASFDHGRVKGLVAQLIDVADTRYATALEVTAGSRLYNVVVDTEGTGKALLEKGNLKRRVTIIPLNKISAQSLNESTVANAQRMCGAANVQQALSLVGYDDQLEAAMKYVFGTTLVCETLDIAKKVTFDKSIKTRSVTLDGDTFDPSGTLTGGARSQQQPVLSRLQELRDARTELAERNSALKELDVSLTKMREAAKRRATLEKKHELLEHSNALFAERVQSSPHFRQMEELDTLAASIETLKTAVDVAKQQEKQLKERVKRIEDDMKHGQAKKKDELKKLQTALAAAKKALTLSQKQHQEAETHVESLRLELAELHNEVKALGEQATASEAAIAKLVNDVDKAERAREMAAQRYDEAKDALDEVKAKLAAANDEIGGLRAQCEALATEKTDGALQLKKKEHALQKLTVETKEAGKQVDALASRNPWIAQEQVHFGKVNTDYDFSKKNPAECRRKLNKLRENQSELAKGINMKVMNMFGKAEQEYTDLLKKKTIVEQDKEKIGKAIDDLDEKKNEALRKTYVQVNRDFGSIFSTLLPGANAKLSPPEGGTVLDGLCVRVAFGDSWKESLTELSGGQRSLVALSLILSLLLFKPAPMYILDEVDAALDLSHTQNIGHMLKTHFSHSQFIVVSLKDGMFNNANVLFKTKFVDNISTVTRIAQQQKALGASSEEAKENASASTAAKGKGKAPAKTAVRGRAAAATAGASTSSI